MECTLECDQHGVIRARDVLAEDDADTWTFVRKKKRSKRSKRAPPRAVRSGPAAAAASRAAAADAEEEESEDALAARVRERCEQLGASKLYAWLRQSAAAALGDGTDVVDIVVYGVGRFIETDAALQQLACALRLRRDVAAAGRVELFEPLLSNVEQRAARALGFELIARNELGWRPIGSRRTLFFMPHCPKWLYHNVLASNWSRESLRRVIIVGNSFTVYAQHDLVWDDDAEGVCAATIERACTALVERAQPRWKSGDESAAESRLRTAFSDASVHSFAFDETFALEPVPKLYVPP